MAPGRDATVKTRAAAAQQVSLSPGEEVRDKATGERFRILSLLAEGGMGRVFRAEQVATGAVVAVKCHRPIDADHTALKLRLEKEGAFLKQLGKKPHICPVLATGMRDDGLSWIAMPLLDGASVGQLLGVLPRIPLVWTLTVVRAVCIALAHAHGHAIHRDIKPENVFVTRDGGVFVLDWGAGKFYSGGRLTTTGTTIGTIAFMSPEQLTDPDHLTGRSDLFSTGVTFFLMLSGQHPFDPDGPLQGNAFAIAHRILAEPPRSLPKGLPSYVEEVAARFLQKDPHHRYRSAVEAAEVVDAALNRLVADLGEMPPLQDVLTVYDRAAGAAAAAEGPPPDASGPRAKGGTIPLGPAPEAFARAHATIRMGPPRGASPGAGGTIRMGEIAARPVPPRAPRGPEAPLPRRATGAVPLHGQENDEQTARLLAAVETLAAHDHPDSRETLLAVLSTYEDSPVLRAAAATALARIGDESCIEALEIRTAYDLHPMVRRVADDARAAILERLGDPDRPRTLAPMEPAPVGPAPAAFEPAPRPAPSAPPSSAPSAPRAERAIPSAQIAPRGSAGASTSSEVARQARSTPPSAEPHARHAVVTATTAPLQAPDRPSRRLAQRIRRFWYEAPPAVLFAAVFGAGMLAVVAVHVALRVLR